MECKYITDEWGTLHKIYYCLVQNPVSINSREASTITSVSGSHISGKSNDDVFAVDIKRKTVNYFPKGIEKIFKNLQGISISNSGLQEITQSDLSVFPELVNLILTQNNIQVLEQGLFDINPKLTYINLNWNKISQIHPK